VVYPCLGRYIFTDQWVGTGNQEPGKVYELGTDSYVLARVTPRRRVEKALDLCTGSGVHAVMSGAEAKVSRAVDINPRALTYTRLNALANGVKCETFLGDLYSPVSDLSYDLITANPPFVPSPDPTVLIHRSAGETGEEVPERLVAGLRDRLAPGGLFSMVLEHPVYTDETYLDRLERWVGETSGWGIAVLNFDECPAGQYIVRHVGSENYEETYNTYLQSYLKHGIQAVRFANVFIKRLDKNRPNFKAAQKCNWPNLSLVSQVEEWLDCLELFSDPGWSPDPQWRPELSPNYTSVWRDWNKARGVLELADHNWFQQEMLNTEETELIYSMKQGDLTVEELQSRWGATGKSEESFLATLRSLGARRALSPFPQA
jgi:methylase of polypeptide subunit release factors